MAADLVRFEDFELDLGSYQVRRSGRTLKLERIPMEVLFLLVERRGQLVTREEIIEKLWGKNVFLDTDNAINTAIRKIRQALKDDPEQPRFVQTVTGRGYRFIGQLSEFAGPVAEQVTPVHNKQDSNTKAAAVGDGLLVSHYRIGTKIASGGMGDVFQAEDIRLRRRVAIKFLSSKFANNSVALERFVREARAASSLNHPNICTIYEIEEHDGRPIMVMEFLEGETLKQSIGRGALEIDRLLDVGISVTAALQAAHAQGIVHRDIKPANIFIGKAGQVKVLDFGLAKLTAGHGVPTEDIEESLTVAGVLPGTTHYMSPEQLRDEEIDGRSDIFSLGIVLYEMATASKPFTGKNVVAISNAILHGNPPSPKSLNPALPSGLDPIVARAMQKDRDSRYQHAAEIAADLQRLKHDHVSPISTSAPIASPAGTGKRWKVMVPAVMAVLLLAVASYLYLHRTPKLTDKGTIVLADFSNTTGDPVFDETLRQGLAVQLEQSPYLSLLSEASLQRTLQLMGRPVDSKLTPDVAREICERNGGAIVLEGSIRSLGSVYVLGLQSKDCSSGNVVDEEQIQASRKEEVLGALTQIATRFRKRVGESLASVEKYSAPLEEGTTSSLEALQFYSRAVKVAFTAGVPTAVPLMQRAVELDPKFALAYSHLGLFYGAIGESKLALESNRKAYELRDRVSERERFFISAVYQRNVSGNLQKALQALELWEQTYPRDIMPHSLISGFMSQGLGKYELSIDEAKRTLSSDPEFTPAYVNQAFSQLYLDRPQDAENTVQQAFAHKLRVPELLLVRYLVAHQKGDVEVMEQTKAAGQDMPGAEDWLLHAQSLALARSGRLVAAREASGRAVQLAEAAGERERAATYKGGLAVWEALYGNSTAARANAQSAVQLGSGREAEYAAAFALAISGNSASAEQLANDLNKRFPEDTSVIFNYLPGLRGVLALQRGAPGEAIDSLQPATSYEFAVSALAFNYFFGNFNPVYARGQALLAAGRPTEAVSEFNKIITHRGLLMVDPLDAIARLQVARAYTKLGEVSKAKLAYEELLSIWKDADRDLQLVRQARSEFSRLQ